MRILRTNDFLPLNPFEGAFPIKVDLVYAQPRHRYNHFKSLYHPSARSLYAHKAMVQVVLLASVLLEDRHGWTLKLLDGLRPVEAQEKMATFGYDPELASSPGQGAHTRGMAIDVQPVDKNGNDVDMGTPFDYIAKNSRRNEAARDCVCFKGKTDRQNAAIVERRAYLTQAMQDAAKAFGQRIQPLSQKWWVYCCESGIEVPSSLRARLAVYWGDFLPVKENDLPGFMHVVNQPSPVPPEIAHLQRIQIAAGVSLVCQQMRELTVLRPANEYARRLMAMPWYR